MPEIIDKLLADPRPWAYLALIFVVFGLERRIPADPDQRILGPGLFQDAVWFGVHLVSKATLYALWLAALHVVYDRYLSFLTLDSLVSWPAPARVAVAILAGDFLAWLHHYLRHKIRWFWPFHAVHHAQQQMNLFTDNRVHPLDRLIATTLTFIPLFMVEASFPDMLAWAVFLSCYTKFYHANIRTNFGILRYVLVTPQSHRIHHSPELRHRDMNFGVFFSIWDRLFGTQYPVSDEYPVTGIEDPDFPSERGRSPLALARSTLFQLCYPFRALWRSEHKKLEPGDGGIA